jgi:hypothetical protein
MEETLKIMQDCLLSLKTLIKFWNYFVCIIELRKWVNLLFFWKEENKNMEWSKDKNPAVLD